MAFSLIQTTSTYPETRGLDYLYAVRSLALDPEMIDLIYHLDHRISVCVWISQHIEAINAQLNTALQVCHHCFHVWERPSVEIYAAPLSQSFGLDAMCNLQTNPITLLIDVGRIVPQDWLLVVAHEYAHAHVGSPGHHPQFARSLTHLCLGLAIAPPSQLDNEDCLRFHPPHRSTHDPLAFWRGEGSAEQCA